MRIGMHLGSFVGGVIGTTKLRYDIWGFDVLIANNVESNGVPGKIVVTEELKNIPWNNENLNFSFNKEINVEGEKLNTYSIDYVNPAEVARTFAARTGRATSLGGGDGDGGGGSGSGRGRGRAGLG